MKVYGLIGNPLGHSFSKQYFTEKFEREHTRDCRFELYPLTTIQELIPLLEKEKELRGLAVTIPYKETVIPLLDSVDKVASDIGAVNCISIIAGRLTGYNTDCIGFEGSLIPLLQDHHNRALVLGSGGSSKAVQYVLKKLGIRFLVVSRATSSADRIRYEQLDATVLEKYPLIINCTPVGMYPNQEECPEIPYQYLSSKHLLFDLVYRPDQTRFLKEGLLRGATTKNGYEMLILQAEENWRIWNS